MVSLQNKNINIDTNLLQFRTYNMCLSGNEVFLMKAIKEVIHIDVLSKLMVTRNRAGQWNVTNQDKLFLK